MPEKLTARSGGPSSVLVAPPGAGKTTAVAPALIGEAWCAGTVILLSPRRLAARAAAERMAETLGEKAGETIGYLTRLDTRRSARTRVLVMTEAIFVSTILADPDLPGVSAVLFDEAHERHLDSDLGLALAIESQQVLREDLKLLVMSATIDGARFATLLGDAPVIESQGKAYPLDIRWLGARPELRVEDAMASAVLAAWREQQGDILAFLPGVGEIERTRERLADKLPDALVLPLHGQCDPAAQRIAIRRDSGGRRRIVIASAIAETSLTLDGVSVVVDCGLSRRAEFDKAAGVTRLVTHRSSQASAAQRAGRAARQGPGVVYRLWEEAAHAGHPAYDPPEMLVADLSALVLSLAKWGARDPAALAWLDPPPLASVQAAQARLAALGAVDGEGAITTFGQQVASLPMEPAQAAMVLFGAEAGQARNAAQLALLLQERGLGSRGEDLLHRLTRWNGDRSPRAEAARKLAQRWAARAEKLVGGGGGEGSNPAQFLARAMPDNVARSRDGNGESWLSVGGRGYVLDPASPLARAEWLVIGDAQGAAKGTRITAAAALTGEEVEQALAHRIARRSLLSWNAAERRVEARLERRLGAITLASGPDPQPDAQAVEGLLLEKACEQLEELLPASLMARARHAEIDALAAATVKEKAQDWLAPLLAGRRDLDLPRRSLTDALMARLNWDARERLDRLAPREFVSPAGTSHAIDYADEAGPAAELRVQALFGLDQHPTIGQPPQNLLLKLTSPAGRPIQSTRDLSGFWRGSWRDVQREMKGRYPKHRWPDEPWVEKPSLKTKHAFSRGQS
ncbi:MAG: ATP-dependent helicase HrpB [Novosphingobium sp.]|nr:ATP-dependent helicase HrpB [Novosphingobium sp.]